MASNLDDRTLVTALAACVTVEAFTAAVASAKGLDLRDVEPLTTLIIATRNSVYRVIVSRGMSVVVQGGSFFPDPTQAQLDGASVGGSLLKLGWIGIGLRMEIRTADQRIVTSPIRSIAAESCGATGTTH